MKNSIVSVITPSPPIWINMIITICPNIDQYDPVSRTTSPVTQTHDVEVNNASTNGVTFPSLLAKGNISSNAPTRITRKKPKTII